MEISTSQASLGVAADALYKAITDYNREFLTAQYDGRSGPVILTREQLTRYLRQLIMPEISGPGQKKLLESTVLICGESVNDLAPVVYYMAASGVGSLYCHLDDAEGFAELADRVHDLNGDVSIGLTDGSQGEFRVFLGRSKFIINNATMIFTGFAPSVISIFRGWKGGMEVFKNAEDVHFFLTKLSDAHPPSGDVVHTNSMEGEIFSTCLLGALSAMEVIKLALGIGETARDFRYIDLLAMEFLRTNHIQLEERLQAIYAQKEPEHLEVNPCESLSKGVWRGMDKKIARPPIRPRQAQLHPKLRDSKALIVGTGGLGSPAAYALALSGVGAIGLVDYDAVELSNLNRQILHATSRIGMAKVKSAAEFLKSINPHLKLNIYHTGLSEENVYDIIAGYDVVIDAVDNFPTRFLLNDACFFAGKPMIEAGIIRFDGTCMTMIPQKSPCYRCMLPELPPPGSVPSCSESGVLGPVPGILGFIQAAEAVKLLTDQGNRLDGRIIFYDGLSSDFLIIKLSRKSVCPLCGANPTIHELQKYEYLRRDDAE